jgi:hypothetical protein
VSGTGDRMLFIYRENKKGRKQRVQNVFSCLLYESIKREVKIKPIYECRCDERLKTKAEESTRLNYTGFLGELEHLKIKTRLIDEKFASVMGEYVFLK